MNKSHLTYAVGTTHQSNNYGSFEIIEYISSRKVKIRFLNTKYVNYVNAASIKAGQVKDPLKPTIIGVGFMGEGMYTAKAPTGKSKVYGAWYSMLARCYDKMDSNYPRYGAKGVEVYHEWHNFQTFAAWYHHQCKLLGVDPENHDYQLDKDLGSTYNCIIYSQYSCQLVSAQVNTEEAHAKHYEFVDPNGEVVKVYNLAKFCRDNGLTQSSLSRVHTGKLAHHKGWTKAAVV